MVEDFEEGALAHETWEPCSVHAVVLAFLQAEWDKPLLGAFPLRMLGDRRIIDDADIENAVQNNLRTSLLWLRRAALLQWIPTDTQWFEVRFLRAQHFHQIRAINCPEWRSPEDSNELLKVAIRKPDTLRSSVSAWQPPIFWGHDQDGPFTVLEGNHRMAALAGSEQRSGCALTVYVGLSAELCRWHLPDKAALIDQGWPPSAL